MKNDQECRVVQFVNYDMGIEKINQYLREHGYDPEKVGLRGQILVEALTRNIIAREIIQRLPGGSRDDRRNRQERIGCVSFSVFARSRRGMAASGTISTGHIARRTWQMTMWIVTRLSANTTNSTRTYATNTSSIR